MLRFTCLTLLLLTACGTDPGDTQSTTSGQTAPGSTSDAPDSTTAPTTGASTSDGGATDAGTTAPGTTTSDPDTTSSPTTGDLTATTGETGDDTTGTPGTTTGEPSAFHRFRLDKAAGPCPPDADCDGFIELEAPLTLRVEKFGDIPDNVTEVQISQADFDAAALVLGDELFALLAQDDILCDPPTDVFESMELDLDGDLAANTTTACTQPPIVAARDKANELAAKYVP